MSEPTIREMIESRRYLLEFQKKQLVEDFREVPSDDERIGEIMDDILHKLFDRGWNDLTAAEQQNILYAWRGK